MAFRPFDRDESWETLRIPDIRAIDIETRATGDDTERKTSFVVRLHAGGQATEMREPLLQEVRYTSAGQGVCPMAGLAVRFAFQRKPTAANLCNLEHPACIAPADGGSIGMRRRGDGASDPRHTTPLFHSTTSFRAEKNCSPGRSTKMRPCRNCGHALTNDLNVCSMCGQGAGQALSRA